MMSRMCGGYEEWAGLTGAFGIRRLQKYLDSSMGNYREVDAA